MKKLTTTLFLAFALIGAAFAGVDPYVGAGISGNISSSGNEAEVYYKETNAVLFAGIRDDGKKHKLGVMADLTAYNAWNVGAAVGAIYNFSDDFNVTGGLAVVQDVSTAQTKYGQVKSDDTGTGAFIGVEYKGFGARVVHYEVGHSYQGVLYDNAGNVLDRDNISNDVSRTIGWLGYTLEF